MSAIDDAALVRAWRALGTDEADEAGMVGREVHRLAALVGLAQADRDEAAQAKIKAIMQRAMTVPFDWPERDDPDGAGQVRGYIKRCLRNWRLNEERRRGRGGRMTDSGEVAGPADDPRAAEQIDELQRYLLWIAAKIAARGREKRGESIARSVPELLALKARRVTMADLVAQRGGGPFEVVRNQIYKVHSRDKHDLVVWLEYATRFPPKSPELPLDPTTIRWLLDAIRGLGRRRTPDKASDPAPPATSMPTKDDAEQDEP